MQSGPAIVHPLSAELGHTMGSGGGGGMVEGASGVPRDSGRLICKVPVNVPSLPSAAPCGAEARTELGEASLPGHHH